MQSRIQYTVRLECRTCQDKVFEQIGYGYPEEYNRAVVEAISIQNDLPPEHVGHDVGMHTETKVV